MAGFQSSTKASVLTGSALTKIDLQIIMHLFTCELNKELKFEKS